MNENYDDCHHRKKTRKFIYTKSNFFAKCFYIQKARHFSKSWTISVKFLYIESYTFHVTGFFMKILRLAFIYKKHDTLRYVTFLYTKSQTLRKKQDNLRYVLYTKIRQFCVTRFFIEFLKFAEGGGTFIDLKNNILCVTSLYTQNNALCVTLRYTKSLTL